MFILRPSHERGFFNHGWLQTYHSFSFGEYYDPKFMGFSALRVINEDVVLPDMGFGMHPHKDMEILTYVLSGAVAHKDSMGNSQIVPQGEFQLMSAGTGVRHSEFNPSHTDQLHLYQIWIMPNQLGIPPRYEQARFDDKIGGTLILSPTGENGSLRVYQDMKLWRYQMDSDQQIPLNHERAYWLQVVKGTLSVGGQSLSAGDGLAIVQENTLNITDTGDGAEVLLFDLPPVRS